ncbi:MAG: DsrE family protein [Alphaproteobacteria bacterium]|nr:DsrE family protein [Alphaproteobacteria bacterium]MBF0249244.1 DsrE family protein [Alphaproteobacteria bacterium]
MTVLGSAVTARAGTLAEPAPSIDNPRMVVLTLNEKDDKRVNAVLSNAINIQKFYGADNVMIAIVAYGPGIWSVLADSPVKARVESLMMYDVEFIACGNTLESIHRDDLLEGVERVQAGLPEIIERRLSGWVDLNP